MGIATHLGPWLLGTVKETTGTNAALGQIRNTGATTVSQTATVAFSAMTTSPTAQNLFTIPAGAKILRFNVEKLVAISGGGVTAVNTSFGTSTSAAAYSTAVDIGLTTAQTARATLDAALVSSAANNIGTVDQSVFGTFTAVTGNPTAGSAVVTIEYIVRQPDGSAFPASA